MSDGLRLLMRHESRGPDVGPPVHGCRWVRELNGHPGHCDVDHWHGDPIEALACHRGAGPSMPGGPGNHEESRMHDIYRQGDILLARVDEAPEGKRAKAERGRLILARGEVTGHHHSVAVQNAEVIEAAEGVFLRIMSTTTLDHQEHGSITLPPGDYRVTRQREYVPQELPRQVAD